MATQTLRADHHPVQSEAAARSRAPILITPEGERELRRQLVDLRHQIEDDVPQRLRRAREFGGVTGNDDHLQIREEEMVIGARIASLSRILERARVVTEIADQVGTARIGSTITLRVDGRTVVRSLRGAHETIGRDEMSASSPIGQAVIGRPPGTNVSVEMPNGAFRCVEIVAVVDEDGDQASTRPRRIA